MLAGIYFGGFQALMPAIGYLLGVNFQSMIERFDHWIAFILLSYIGGKMILSAVRSKEEDVEVTELDQPLNIKEMFILAIATSIDALAVGIAFSCDGMEIYSKGLLLGVFASCGIICATTFVLSAIGVKIGKLLENKLKKRAEIAGGVVLILLGCKILFEHLSGISIFK